MESQKKKKYLTTFQIHFQCKEVVSGSQSQLQGIQYALKSQRLQSHNSFDPLRTQPGDGWVKINSDGAISSGRAT